MKLIVGLGNPGQKYEATRHNAGFWLVERFAAQSGTVLRKDGKFQALVGRHGASGVWLVLPQSYMNSSGRPVQMMASFFKIAPADILVVHDELDFAPGTVRIKQGGGIAGHNGLKDISGRLGSHDYWRLRIGIGHPGERNTVTDYVLHKPAQEERTAIDSAIDRALEVLPLVLGGDMQGAMLKLHTDEKAAVAPPPREAEERTQPEKAESKTPAPPRKTGKAERPQKAKAAAPAKPAEDAGGTSDAAAAKPEKSEGKKGALGSFLKKLLPDTHPKSKK
ncbi:MAG: aminoacyl-tRNA hydrolase [Betaproteobacteria bacterium]|nr:MAG: aminoacyl-tRNA hydrolase [Betaproteobacteria bacterium]